jgi:hypothetical protein
MSAYERDHAALVPRGALDRLSRDVRSQMSVPGTERTSRVGLATSVVRVDRKWLADYPTDAMTTDIGDELTRITWTAKSATFRPSLIFIRTT